MPIAAGQEPLPDGWNVFAPGLRADPFPAYRRLRETGRLHPTPFGTYLVPHYDDCTAVLGDSTWGHGYFAGINPFRPGVDPERLPGSFLLMDPPDHTRLRGLVSKAFTMRAVTALRPRVTEIVDELLDQAIEAGKVDIVTALAHPLPLITICEVLGVPAADRILFGGWTRDISRGLDPDALLTDAERSARTVAVEHFAEYFGELIAWRRDHPGPDLLSQLVEVEDGGDTLTVKELLDICVLLLIGGHETTMNLISNAVLALERHPDQRALLCADPGLASRAVEEFLRYDTPVPFPTRVALSDTELAGQRLPRGTGVILLVGSANRDQNAFPDPDRLDLTRFGGQSSARRHLAFSHGPHFCLGAPLARLECEIAFERLVRRAPGFRVLAEAPRYWPSVSMRGPAELPVALRPESSRGRGR